MTEYDYSPEAYERFMATQQRIAKWVDNTEAHAHEFQAPGVPPVSDRSKTLRRRRSFVSPSHPNVMMQAPGMSYFPEGHHEPPMVYAPVPGPMPSPPAMHTGFMQSPMRRSRSRSIHEPRPSPAFHAPVGIIHNGLQYLHSPSPRASHRMSSGDEVTPDMSASMVGAPRPMPMMYQSPPPSPLASPPPMMFPNQVSPIYSYPYAPAPMTYGYPMQSPLPQSPNYMVIPPKGRSVKVIYV